MCTSFMLFDGITIYFCNLSLFIYSLVSGLPVYCSNVDRCCIMTFFCINCGTADNFLGLCH